MLPYFHKKEISFMSNQPKLLLLNLRGVFKTKKFTYDFFVHFTINPNKPTAMFLNLSRITYKNIKNKLTRK